jgi:DHA1 family multidrug resistance protein-like MFS transporter
MLRVLQQTYLAVFRRYPLLVPLALITACGELVYAGINNFSIPLLLEHQGRTLGVPGGKLGLVVGTVTSTFLVSETLLRIPFGWLSDRWGRARMIALGPLVGCVSPALIAHLGHYLWIFPLRVLDGLGAAALWPSLFALVGDRVERAWRATAMSVMNMIYVAAVALGPALAGLVIRLTGSYRAPFYGASALLLVAGLVGLFWLGRVPALGRDGGSPEAEPEAHAHRPVGRSTVALMLLITFSQSFAIIMLSPFLVLYGSRVLGLTETRLGLLFIGPAVGVALLSIPFGRLADRWSKQSAVKVALVLAALTMWLLPQTVRLPVLILIATLFALAYALGTPAWFAIMSEIAPERARGKVFGGFGTAQGLGAVAGPIVGGYLWEIDRHYPFYASAAVLTLAALLAVACLRTHPLDRGPAVARAGNLGGG